MQPLQLVQKRGFKMPFNLSASSIQGSTTPTSFTSKQPVERWLVRVLNHISASPALTSHERALVAGNAEAFNQGEALQVLNQTSLTIRDREVSRCYTMRRALEHLLQDNAKLFEQTAYGRQRAAEFRQVASEVQRDHDFDIILVERVFAQAQGMVGLFQELREQRSPSHE